MDYIKHIHYPLNTEGKDFVMGDLHGCFDKFEEKLEEVEFDFNNDRLFSVGDLIDRGPNSLECLKLIENPWFFPVIGNHEDMMLRAVLKGQAKALWIMNGGDWSLTEKYGTLKTLCDKMLAEVPLTLTISTAKGDVGITHAQVSSDMFLEVTEQVILWSRENIENGIEVKMLDVAKTYHGHTPVAAPVVLGDNEYIDTGACFPDLGVLTVKELWT